MTPSEEFFSGFAAQTAASQHRPKMPHDLVHYQSLVFAKLKESTHFLQPGKSLPAGPNFTKPAEFNPLVTCLREFLLGSGLLRFAMHEADADSVFYQPPRQSYCAPEVIAVVRTRYVPSGRFDGKGCAYQVTVDLFGLTDQVELMAELTKNFFEDY